MKNQNYSTIPLEQTKPHYEDALYHTVPSFEGIIGESRQMQQVFTKINHVAPTDTTVLISGETGTGKELIAQAIHNLSKQIKGPYIKINCAALPANLVESELFGHEKGSFTGATGQRLGKFEMANNGTIFLDEISEMPLELQAKILRVIQEREIERIGGNVVIKLNIRIIVATNRDLQQEVLKNRFRSDLFYRLNVFQIQAPPLKDRENDILILANYFLKSKVDKMEKNITNLSESSKELLLNYSWPGNVRELEHAIESSIIMCDSTTLDLRLMVDEIERKQDDLSFFSDLKTMDGYQKDAILHVLKYTKGKIRGKDGAAEILGLKPNTLDARIKKLGIIKIHGLTDF